MHLSTISFKPAHTCSKFLSKSPIEKNLSFIFREESKRIPRRIKVVTEKYAANNREDVKVKDDVGRLICKDNMPEFES